MRPSPYRRRLRCRASGSRDRRVVTLPNFLVVGAGRSGTTSLHHYLAQHPQVYLCPEKSPNFFVASVALPEWEGPTARRMAAHWIRDRAAYEALFDRVLDETAFGEVSPVYLQALAAPAAIHGLCPEARIIAILRDPVDRAHAHFLGRRRDGIELRTSFRHVVAEELSRPLPEEVAFGSYLGCGRYHHFLSPYFRLFPRERIRVYLFEDLRSDATELMRDLFGFLGVDTGFAPNTTERYGSTGEIRSPLMRAAWTRSVALRTALRPHLPGSVRRALGAPFVRRVEREALEPDLRSELVEVFREDIGLLQELTGRDLRAWLE